MKLYLILLLFLLPLITCASIPYLGHDISSLLELEGQGVTYNNQNGVQQPLETILKAGGTNSVRLRLWVNPTGGYCDLAYNVKLASRMQQAGLKIYIDIHFSDTWADPSHQITPSGWPSDLSGLLKTVRNYTEYVSSTFVKNGIHIDIISIGNEIVNGLLWPLGQEPNYENIGMILKQASLGVKAGAPTNTPKIMIHLPGVDISSQEYFYDSVLKYNNFTLNDFDVQGFSFYPFYGTTETLANLNSTLTQMWAKYGKLLVVAETDWPVACPNGPALSEPTIPVSVQGQLQWVSDIIRVISALPKGSGTGIFYWEPAWIGNANLGSGCSDNLLFTATTAKLGTARASVNMFN